MGSIATSETFTVTAGSMAVPGFRERREVPAGTTISDVVESLGLDGIPAGSLRVWIDDHPISPSIWPRVRPKPGRAVLVGVMPSGGVRTTDGGLSKGTLRMAGSVGVGLLAGFMTRNLSGLAQYMARTGLWAFGTMAINALIPYVEPDENARGILTGSGNRLNEYGEIPRPYGRFRFAPPLAAMPVTEVRGSEQWLRLLFVLGYKPLRVHQDTIEVGGISLSEHEHELQIADGFDNPGNVEGWSDDIYEEPLSLPLEPALTADGGWSLDKVVLATTRSDTEAISLDIGFPDGLGEEDDEYFHAHQVAFAVRYRSHGGGGSWIPVVPNDARFADEFEASDCTLGSLVDWTESLASMLTTQVDYIRDNVTIHSWQLDQYDGVVWIYDLKETLRTFLRLTSDPEIPATDRARIYNATEVVKRLLGIVGVAMDQQRWSSPTDEWRDAWADLWPARLLKAHAELMHIRIRYRYISEPIRGSRAFQVLSASVHSPDIAHIYGTWEADTFEIENKDAVRGPHRGTIAWSVPRGRYDVQVRRVTALLDDDAVREAAALVTLRSVRHVDSVSTEARDRYALMSLAIKATDQLSGSLGALTVEVESPLRYSDDGATWETAAIVDGAGGRVADNPAWIVADILTGAAAGGNALDESRVDVARLREFADFCISKGFGFAGVFDSARTIVRAMQDVCRVAQAFPAMRDGQYSVVMDKEQATPVALITPRNSSRFSAVKAMGSIPDALRIRFVNPANDWKQDEIHVYNDGYGDTGRVSEIQARYTATADSLTIPFEMEEIAGLYDVDGGAAIDLADYAVIIGGGETVIARKPGTDTFGAEIARYRVTGTAIAKAPVNVETISTRGLVDVPEDPSHAWYTGRVVKFGRYLLASRKLRPEVFSVSMDFENLVFELGDLVEFQHDVVLWGLATARITAITRDGGGDVTSIGIDESVEFGGDTYGARVRRNTGTLTAVGTLSTSPGLSSTLTFTSAFEDDDGSGDKIAVGDLVAVGEASTVTIPCLVKEIRPSGDLEATVSLVEYSGAIYEALDGPIPEYDARIYGRADVETVAPPRPSVLSVETGEGVLVRGTDGSYQPRVLVRLRAPTGMTQAQRDVLKEVDSLHVQIRRSPDRVEGTGDPMASTRVTPTAWRELPLVAGGLREVSISEVQTGDVIDVRLQYVTKHGVGSEWATVLDVVVLGNDEPPGGVGTLAITSGVLAWNYDPPADFAGFKVRHAYGRIREWDLADPLHRGLVISTAFDLSGTGINHGVRSFLVKAVDTAGNESATAGVLIHDFGVAHFDYSMLYYRSPSPAGAWAWGYAPADESPPGLITIGPSPDYAITVDGNSATTAQPFFASKDSPAWNEDGLGKAYYRKWPKTWIYQALSPLSTPPYFEAFDIDITAERWRFLQRNKAASLWIDDVGAEIWPGSLSGDFWPSATGWHAVTGATQVKDGDAWEFAVEFPAQDVSQKPTINSIVQNDSVPGVVEEVFDRVAAAGTLTYSLQRSFRSVQTVQATLVQSGSYPNARSAEVTSKGTASVTVKVYDSAHSLTAGVVDLRIQGY